MKKYLVSLVVFIFVASLLFSSCATPAPKPTPAPTPAPAPPPAVEPIVWKAATFLPRNMLSVKSIFPIAERAKQRSNGQLTIEYLGGPEVTPAMQQGEAVRKGVIQMSIVPGAYYDGIVPMGNMLELSELTPAEERASGAYDFINDLHKKGGLFYLERGTAIKEPAYFNIILKQPIEKPQQLAGKKIGATSPNVTPFLDTIGAAAAVIPAPQVYTSLERGIIEGFSYPLTNSMDAQLHEVTKYVIDHPYYQAGSAIIINLDSWNKLPPNLQTLMTNIAKEVVAEYMSDLDKEMAKARQTALDKGMKFIKFSSPDDVAWFYKTLYDAMWADNIKRYPDVAPKFRALVTKKK